MKSRLLYFFAVFTALALMPLATLIPAYGAGRDDLRVISADGSVYEIPVEEYVVRAVAAEYGAVTEEEALKALAVTVRTAAHYVRLHGLNHAEAEFCVSQGCCFPQEDPGTAGEKAFAAARAAAEATEGEILKSENGEAMALYTLCSCGATRDCPEFPDVAGVKYGSGCEKHVFKTKADLFALFPDASGEEYCLITCEDGYCVYGVIGNKLIPASEIAEKAGLPSVKFFAEKAESGKALLTCRGAGNGYGLDLCYSGKAADEGFTYDEILKLFFPNYTLYRGK
ncbi:MAG: hypothetical protein J5793_01450 [Clostridia bacterium]|nr:hypothetical protein [Clostridia bacterium]